MTRWMTVLLVTISCAGNVARAQDDKFLLPPLEPCIMDEPAPQEPAPARPTTNTLFPMGGGGALGMPGDLLFRSPARYQLSWFPQQTVTGQATELGWWRQDLALAAPVYRSDGDMLLLTANAAALLFQGGAILPDSQRAFPEALYNLRLGLMGTHAFANGWSGAVGVNVGSASDRPFNNLRDMQLGVNAFLRVPHGDRDAWLFALIYSPTGEIAFPIPGVSYFWNPSDSFSMNIGVPFTINWRPTEDWSVQFSYMLMRTINARTLYRLSENLRFHAGFSWTNESYFLNDREDSRERLFYYDKKLSIGAQALLGQHGVIDLSGGYSFDRFFFTGRQWDDRNHDRVTLADTPYLSLTAGWKW